MALVEEFKISGLKCDTQHCNWRDDSVSFEEYPKRINSKCPMCGSNLLTQKEYEQCLRMYRIVDVSNRVANVLKWLNPMHYYRLATGTEQDTVTIQRSFPKKKRGLTR